MLFLIRNIAPALPHHAVTAQVLSHDASYIFAAGRDGSVAVLELHVFGSAFESRKQAEKKTVLLSWGDQPFGVGLACSAWPVRRSVQSGTGAGRVVLVRVSRVPARLRVGDGPRADLARGDRREGDADR